MMRDRFNPLSPRHDFDRIMDEVDRLLSDAVVRTQILPRLRGLRAPIDLYDTGDELILHAALPGAVVDDIDISIDAMSLTLRGKTGYQLDEEEANNLTWYRREMSGGGFTETVTLPVAVDPDQVSATLENGILTLLLPKTERSTARRIRPSAVPKNPPVE